MKFHSFKKFFFWYGYPIVSAPFVQNIIFSSLNCLYTFVKNQFITQVSVNICALYSALFSNNTVFITEALHYHVMWILFVFLLEALLAIPFLFLVHIIFGFSLSIMYIITYRILVYWPCFLGPWQTNLLFLVISCRFLGNFHIDN